MLLAMGCKNDESVENVSSNDPTVDTTGEPTVEPEYPELRSEPGSMARGADIGWLSEMEHDGKKFYNASGEATDCIELLGGLGCNAIRLRVWVDPYGGWSGKDDVVNMAVRARKAGLRLMIDFHYSDFFCDPSRQTLPYAWKDYTFEQVREAIAAHTLDVLGAIKDKGLEPEWVQVGNEITPGMVFPHGQLWDSNGDLPNNYKNLSTMTNAGYEAVKQMFPNAKVILHCNNAFENKNWWYRRMKAAGAKFDVIGLSHYPMDNSSKTYSDMNKDAVSNLKLLVGEFGVPVMFVEFGTKSNNQSGALACVEDFLARVKDLPLTSYAGVLYWEPQVWGSWKPSVYSSSDAAWNQYHVGTSTLNWGSYGMGAFTNAGQPNDALKRLMQGQ